MNKKNLSIAGICFLVGTILLLAFDMFAPYCAKHTCCAEAPGLWSIVPTACFFILAFACLNLMLGLAGDEENETDGEAKEKNT